jgi:hypothetical protein
MKTSFLKIMTAALGLSLLAAPMAADAATYGYAHAGPHGASAGVVFRGGPGPGYHGGFNGPGYHGGFYGRGGYGPGYYGYHGYGGYYHPVYRPVAYGYARPVPVFYNGYFGFAPAGWSGYYYNGFWYHHRRWSGGVWIYF